MPPAATSRAPLIERLALRMRSMVHCSSERPLRGSSAPGVLLVSEDGTGADPEGEQRGVQTKRAYRPSADFYPVQVSWFEKMWFAEQSSVTLPKGMYIVWAIE